MNEDNKVILNFEMESHIPSIIKVIGVGGGGSNAVNYMYNLGIKNVDFVVCNTDLQALAKSPIPTKIQLGQTLTEGLGAGSKPEIGRQAAIESLDEITEVLSKNTKMVFITAGMGGGTGTGAAPIIAKTAKEMGILTVAIVTLPFEFEGMRRYNQAVEGIREIKEHVDSLIIINNQKLREIYGDLTFSEAFSKADDVLATAAKGIAEIITFPGIINLDFADVKSIMTDSGVAILGNGIGEGQDRALEAIKKALDSPLLNNSDIRGARDILLNITFGTKEATIDEIGTITDYVKNASGNNININFGVATNPSLEDKISVTIIATGFQTNSVIPEEPKKTIINFDSNKAQSNKKKTIVFDIGQQELNFEQQSSISDNTANTKEDIPIDLTNNEIIDNLENTPAINRINKDKQLNQINLNSPSNIVVTSNKNDILNKENPFLSDAVD